MPDPKDALLRSSDDADDGFDNHPVAFPVQRCKRDRTHWLKIELVDEDGNAVVGEPYKIVACDGQIRKGTTGDKGTAKERELAGGDCQVSFPERERSAWGRSEETEARFIEISLVETGGSPAANEPYLLELPDGSVREGRLDDDGFAREEGTGEGDGRVWFYNKEVELLS